MPDPSYHAPRNTAWFALAALALVLVAGILFDTGQTPLEYAFGYYAPTAIVAAIPLLYIAIALTRGPSRTALALGVAYPAVLLIALWLTLSSRYSSGTEGSMDVVFMFLFFWVSKAWMLFVLLFVPAMVRLLVVSWRAYRQLPNRRLASLVKWAAVMVLVMMIAAIPIATVAEEIPEYRPDVVNNAIGPLYECLWRVAGPGAEAGFPDSLSAIRTVDARPLQNDGNNFPNRCIEELEDVPGYPFVVEYEPRARDSSGRARGFMLRLVEKTRPGGRPRVVWYDESGVRREAIFLGGQPDSTRVVAGSSLGSFLVMQHLIGEYAARHPAAAYPLRIEPEHAYADGRAPVPPGVLAIPVARCGDFEYPTASCFERSDRQFIYQPFRDAAGQPRRYTLTMQPATYYDNVENQPIPSRTHHRDTAGALHSFGGWRAANDQDPPPLPEELTAARQHVDRFAEGRRRDSLHAEQWRRTQDSIWGPPRSRATTKP
jgi:hypothetical protein